MKKRKNTADKQLSGSFRLGNKNADPNPFKQFSAWFREAERSGIDEYDPMHLATSGHDGRPAGRMVLLKSFDSRGFVFYTNYRSAKGKALLENPYVALTFYWKELKYQIRIQGKAIRLPGSESDEYFASRPPESRAGSAVSPQSEVIPDRRVLEKKWKDLMKKTGPAGPERPEFWGGFLVKPYLFEFWKGRGHRLHDRIRYRLIKGKWVMDRLAP